MKATPVPVVSRRYLLDAAPPNTMEAFSPASRATLIKEKAGEVDCCAAPPSIDAIAAATTTSAGRILHIAGMLAPAPELAGCFELGVRLGQRTATAKRQRQLVMRLRAVGRETDRLTKARDCC